MTTTKVTSNVIADDAITQAKIADDAVGADQLASSAVVTASIVDLNVTTAKIAADAVTGAKIADDTINSEHYASESIDTEHIADLNVTTAKIANDAITTAKIADDVELGGNPTTTTQSAGNNTTRIATTAFVTTAVSGASATLTGIDDQSSSNDDQITITDTAVIINEDSDDVDFRVEGNGNANLLNVNAAKDYVSIGSASDFSAGASILHLHQPDATSNAYLHITQEDGGATTSDGMSIGVLDGGANAVIRLRENGYLSTYTNNTERSRLGNTGKQSWSAGGIGDVTTQSRDFTFYTEGGSNGVAINSNDHRIVFMGGAASSGSGMDSGYFQL